MGTDTCCVDGCDGSVYVRSRSLCSIHYNRWRTTGTTDDGPRARLSLEDRFWKHVDKRTSDECWPWIGKSMIDGYGSIGLGGRKAGKALAHRISWEIHNGSIPEGHGYHGTVVRHTCHNRLCVNPAHLALGTQADNVTDMWSREDGPKGNARLSNGDVREIRKSKQSSRVIAKRFGVHHAHIRGIRRKRSWK